jgi:hypothetical protein
MIDYVKLALWTIVLLRCAAVWTVVALWAGGVL